MFFCIKTWWCFPWFLLVFLKPMRTITCEMYKLPYVTSNSYAFNSVISSLFTCSFLHSFISFSPSTWCGFCRICSSTISWHELKSKTHIHGEWIPEKIFHCWSHPSHTSCFKVTFNLLVTKHTLAVISFLYVFGLSLHSLTLLNYNLVNLPAHQ